MPLRRPSCGVLAALLVGLTACSPKGIRTPAETCERPDAGVARPSGLNDLAGPWQLFINDAVIETSTGLARTAHPFTRSPGNPVLIADQPWEGRYVYLYGTVMRNEIGPGYRMWYGALDQDDPTGSSRVLYATSDDGLHWSKPALGIRSLQGSAANNLFIPRERPNHIMSVMHTPWDADCPYKFINFDGAYNVLPAGYDAACSNDGLHLSDLANNPVVDAVAVGVGDVAQFTVDSTTQTYLGYLKINADVAGQRRRAVGYLATQDFVHWPTDTPRLVLAPDAIDDYWVTQAGLDLANARTHFYGVSVFRYQTLFLGILWVFRAQDPLGCTRDCAPPYNGYLFGTIHLELASSRDGIHFDRMAGDLEQGRPALLSTGSAGTWDSMIVVSSNPPVVEGDQLVLYYGGFDVDHAYVGTQGNAAIGRATLRRDGFVSLDAAPDGELVTRILTRTHGPLHVNALVAEGGWIKVEVLDANGDVVTGYSESEANPILGDSTDQQVSWAAHSDLPCIAELRLRFVLHAASLYSFMAGPLAAPVP